MLKRIFTLSSLVLLSYTASAADTPSVETMQKNLSKAIPEIKVEAVKPTPVQGFYEVTSGPAIFYVSENGQYIFYRGIISTR